MNISNKTTFFPPQKKNSFKISFFVEIRLVCNMLLLFTDDDVSIDMFKEDEKTIEKTNKRYSLYDNIMTHVLEEENTFDADYSFVSRRRFFSLLLLFHSAHLNFEKNTKRRKTIAKCLLQRQTQQIRHYLIRIKN